MINAVKATAVIAAVVCTAFAQTPTRAKQSAPSGTFIDKRDGKRYKTVTIGKQTWMAENLSYQPDPCKDWCYENADSNCVKYGRLYDWHMAKTVCPAGFHLPTLEEWDTLRQAVGGTEQEYSVGGLQPSGNSFWVGIGKKLKARSGWNNMKDGSDGNGTDDVGFSALPSYTRDGGKSSNDKFRRNWAGSVGSWWTATEFRRACGYLGSDCDEKYRLDGAYTWNVSNYNNDVLIDPRDKGAGISVHGAGISVRCVAGGSTQSATPPAPPPRPAAPTNKPSKTGGPGTLTDKRDGKTYKTVVVFGDRWMAENLNYQPQSGGSWCFKNADSNCVKYGRLYDFNTAKTVCPAGYHLPSRVEWENIAAKINCREAMGKALKARSGWGDSGNGTDDYGFSALPGGHGVYFSNGKDFFYRGNAGFWWTATENDSGKVNVWSMDYDSDDVRDEFSSKNHNRYYVRCVEDN